MGFLKVNWNNKWKKLEAKPKDFLRKAISQSKKKKKKFLKVPIGSKVQSDNTRRLWCGSGSARLGVFTYKFMAWTGHLGKLT